MVPRPRALVVVLLAVLIAGPNVAAQPQPPNAEQAFAAATQLYEQRLYTDAMASLRTFREHHPHHVLAGEALYLQARAALARGRDNVAARLFDQLRQDHPTHPRGAAARLGLAQYFLDQGDVPSAQEQLATVIETGSDARAARALYLRGTAARQQGRLDAALQDFERVYTTYPDSDVAPAALYAAGATQLRREQYDAAANALETLGQRFPDSPFAQNLGTALAEVYYRLDEYEKAVKELERRLPQIDGSVQARARFLLAESYNQLRMGDSAVQQYRRVLSDFPESAYAVPARYGLAWHHYFAGDYAEAAETFSQVRGSAASDLADRATYYEAVSRARAGAPSQAIKLYRRATDLLAGDRLASEALYESGLLLYQQEEYDAAAAAFRTLIREHPEAPRRGDAHYWLGNTYLADDDLDRALQAYKQATEQGTAPESLLRKVRFRQGWALYTEEQYADAASTFLRLAEADPETSEGASALFWGGDSYYQMGNLSRARSLFDRYLNEHPEGDHRAGAQYALAWTHFHQERFGAAARRFRQFLDTYEGGDATIPYRQDARLRLADSYFALKRYEDAIQAYRQVQGQGADYATYQTAEALNYAGRTDDAIADLERFIEEFPSSPWRPEALYRLGAYRFQQQDYDGARAAYRRLLDSYPDHSLAPEAQYGIGDSYYNAGTMNEAVTAYRTVLEQFPNSSMAGEAASSLFFALSAAGQSGRASALIDSIAARSPDANLRDQLRYNRAKAAFQSGDSDRALSLFQDFVRTASTDEYLSGTYYYLGLLYADKEAYTEATNYLQQLVEQYPSSAQQPQGALRLGDIYLDQEQYQQAAEAYRAAAESDQIGAELRAQARYGEAIALLRLGRSGDAKSLLNGLLEQQGQGPIRASAQLGLGRVYEAEGQPQRALKLYRSVVESADGETGAEALYRLGRLLRRQGQSRAAVTELERMPSLFAGHPEWVAQGLLEQARAYEAMGEAGQAAQLYDQVVRQYSGTPFADSARTAREAL